MDKVDAIRALRPNSTWVLSDDKLTWMDPLTVPPTDEEINDFITKNDYVEKRRLEYPATGDQLDALWAGGQALQDMAAKIQAIKAKYPKNS